MRYAALTLLAATTYALTPNRNIKVARKNTLDSSVTFDEYQNIMVRSRRPVVTRLHAVDATRVHLTMTWVVSFSILRPFGPNRDAPRRRGLQAEAVAVRFQESGQGRRVRGVAWKFDEGLGFSWC